MTSLRRTLDKSVMARFDARKCLFGILNIRKLTQHKTEQSIATGFDDSVDVAGTDGPLDRRVIADKG